MQVPDLLLHGEFGWDPASWLYVLQEKTWWTVPLIPFWHFIGASDTGGLFAILWYQNFPEKKNGQTNPQFWKKWFPFRLKHSLVILCLWTCVWLLGTWPLGRPLQDGWRVMLPVAIASRIGFSLAWTVFTNANHSEAWNRFLAEAPERNYPLISLIMSIILGGPARFNEMLFHDLHHAFPNGVGALSQRGRFYGWEKVHRAAMKAIKHGIFLADDTSMEPPMVNHQRRRSMKFENAGR